MPMGIREPRTWRKVNRADAAGRIYKGLICGMISFVGASALGAEHRFDGVYTGKIVLTKGSAGAMCPAEDDISVTVHGKTLTFTSSILKQFAHPFYPDPDGSFGEIYNDAGGATVHYHGRVIGDVIDADFTDYGADPACEYHWRLTKVPKGR
jgi:hypothetical protein